MKWKIRDIEIPNQIVLSPMAGDTNIAYRKICHDMGAGLVVGEMVSDKAIGFNNEKTLEMTRVIETEHPVSMQLFGHDIESMVNAAIFLDTKTECDIIDINMGCPVNKVIKAKAGSYLLQDPKYVNELVSSIVKAVKKPVTVKIRLGYDNEHINFIEVAKEIERAGASAITLHARTRTMFYSGEANWKYIKELKEAVSIPVIGNGDIRNAIDAKRMLDETGCDAVAIARAALGNPWIFKECVEYIDNGILIDKPTRKDVYDMIINHYNLLKELKGIHLATLEMRSHVSYYIKGLPGASKVKDLCNKETDFNKVLELLYKYLIEDMKCNL